MGSCALSVVSADQTVGNITFDYFTYTNTCPPGAWDNTVFIVPMDGLYTISCFCKTLAVSTNKIQIMRNGLQVLENYSISGFSDNVMVILDLQVGESIWFEKTTSNSIPSRCHMEITSLY